MRIDNNQDVQDFAFAAVIVSLAVGILMIHWLG